MKVKKLFCIAICVICFSLGFSGLFDVCAVSEQPVIVIDAGHGGIDSGASAPDGTAEKHINLNIAAKLNDILTLFGYRTVMTRTSDTDISDSNAVTVRERKVSDIHNRLDLVNSYQNSVLVSIHQNYFEDSRFDGTQVFYSSNNDMGRILASCIQRSVQTLLQRDNTRQIKPSGDSIYILYHASRPSVMVECGFLSNGRELLLLKDDVYCRKMAFAIADGIISYSYGTEVK